MVIQIVNYIGRAVAEIRAGAVAGYPLLVVHYM
jgi:hypothetical protein